MAKKSTGVSYDKLLSDIHSKNYKPIYFLEGEEPYFIDLIANSIAEKVLDESEREFNQTILYGKDVDSARIISESKRFPMMSEKQVVIIKEAQEVKDLEKTTKVSVTVGNKKKEEEINLLEEYSRNPQQTTILVFCYKYKTLDRRKSLAKAVGESGIIFTSSKLYDNEIPGWIDKYVQSQGLKIAPKGSLMMTEYLGNDLSRITNEIEKLKINLKDRKEIQADDVQNYIGISKDYNVFEFQNAIGKRDVVKANKIINYFAANPKENPFVFIIANLYSYFSKLLLYHGSPDKSKQALASALGVNPYFVQDYETAARIYSWEKLRKIIGYLREYDMKSKGMDTGSVEPGELLKELLFKILHC